jgi:hypothetical protein
MSHYGYPDPSDYDDRAVCAWCESQDTYQDLDEELAVPAEARVEGEHVFFCRTCEEHFTLIDHS